MFFLINQSENQELSKITHEAFHCAPVFETEATVGCKNTSFTGDNPAYWVCQIFIYQQ
jgi:hypothetical protein